MRTRDLRRRRGSPGAHRADPAAHLRIDSRSRSNPTGTSTAARSNSTTQLFVSNAMDEKGKPYVAISLGDGEHTIEARGHAYGTNVFDNAGGRSFNFAGMIPGMS